MFLRTISHTMTIAVVFLLTASALCAQPVRPLPIPDEQTTPPARVSYCVSALTAALPDGRDDREPSSVKKIRSDDYLAAQVILALRDVMASAASPSAKHAVAKQIADELGISESPLHEDVLVLVQGADPSTTTVEDLLAITVRRNRPYTRALATEALGKTSDVLVLADLVELLDDQEMTVGADPVTGMSTTNYPVRVAACEALKGLGIPVAPPTNHQYRVERKAVVVTLEAGLPEMTPADQVQTLRAIRRVGGAESEAALRRFVEKFSGNPVAEESVDEAQKLLRWAYSKGFNPYRESIIQSQLKGPERQLLQLREALYAELKSPTQPRRGAGGGMITHEYQIQQIKKAIRNVVAPPTTSGRATADNRSREHLQKLVSEESDPDTQAILQGILNSVQTQ